MKSLKIPHRGHELLEVLGRLGGSARNVQIAQVMDVSEETVRRLVKGLAKAGKVERVHGGTYLTGPMEAPRYSGALEQNSAEKFRIAWAALQFIDDGMTIYINVGSTTTYVAEQLRERSSLVVVTNSISAVSALADHNDNRVFMAGGEILSAERGTFGSSTESFARKFSYDAVIMGVDAISAKQGFLLNNPAEANLARVASRQSKLTIIVADQSKFNGRASMVACLPNDATHLVTDAKPDAALESALLDWGVEINVATNVSKKDA